VFDEAAHIGATVVEVRAAAERAGFDPELLVVDDGSTDGSGSAAAGAGARVIRQPNRGRLEARRAGLAAATGDLVLFLDSRVRIEPDALSFVAENLTLGNVWNGHAVTDATGNPYGRFWNVVSALAFARYLDDPRTTSFGVDDFDSFPKGTTCFLAPRELLVEAFAAFETRYADPRHANDDTPLIRWIAARSPIWISPGFACLYRPRRSLPGFVRHAFHRGIVFLDGHGRRESRYRPVVVAFYPVSAGMVVAAVRWRPTVAVVGGAVAGAAALAAVRKRRPPADVVSFAALAPLYALSHGLGMWRALALRRR
jgi:glycosyltransferase involved in cell wall biosynthesis